MSTVEVQHIQTSIFGRYLVKEAEDIRRCSLLVGFHGYGETAEIQMNRLQEIPDVNDWLCVSIQALHPFYVGKGKIGFSWLTSLERDLRIRENVAYINSVISQIKRDYSINDVVVYCGFSQGVAMACRAALLGDPKPSGVMILGGDIPPEFNDLNRMSRILIGRGKQDRLYSLEKWQADLNRIETSELQSIICTFEGGHHWSTSYSEAAGKFLKDI